MLFVTLGTQDKNFNRLVKVVEEYAKEFNEKVIVQLGHTKYESEYIETYDFLSQGEFEEYIQSADVVITHAGVGSILTALKYHKPLVAAAREAQYEEHTNDHQKEILDQFVKNGYLIPLYDFTKFKEVIEDAKRMEIKEYQSNQNHFLSNLKEYIDSI